MKISKFNVLFIILLTGILFTAMPFVNQSKALDLVHDTDFAITHNLVNKVYNGDGTVTMTFSFEIQNNTDGTVNNVTMEMSSPLLSPSCLPAAIEIGAIGLDETISISGDFTIEDLGLDDPDDMGFMESVLWKMEYDDASGVHHKCYIKGNY